MRCGTRVSVKLLFLSFFYDFLTFTLYVLTSMHFILTEQHVIYDDDHDQLTMSYEKCYYFRPKSLCASAYSLSNIRLDLYCVMMVNAHV